MIKILAVLFCFFLSHFTEKPRIKSREIRNYYIDKGKKSLSAVLKEEYNGNGDLIYASIYKPSRKGLTEVYYYYKYDEHNRKIEKKEFAIEKNDTIWALKKTFEHYNNRVIEKSFDSEGKLYSRLDKFYADSTVAYADSIIGKISFSLAPVEPVYTERTESEKYYYDASNRLARVSRLDTEPHFCNETEFEYKGDSITISKQYDCSGKLVALTTVTKTQKQELKMVEVYSEMDTTRGGTKMIYGSHGYKILSYNYPDSTQGFYTEYSYNFFK